MYIRDIIEKKRRKETLTEEEIRFFIFGYFREEISDVQAATLLNEFHNYVFSQNEMTYMMKAIAATGEELEIYRVSNKLVDIHSIGGMDDKITLMLLAIARCFDIPIAKVIGRELGMEDRLLAIPNYKMEDNIESFKQGIEQNNVGILKSVKDLAPIENKLYKLRREIVYDNDIKLIGISIMSQEIALGFKNIFFHITYGKNAYVKTLSEAKELAKYLKKIGSYVMRNVSCCVTEFNEPIGSSFGNSLEIEEISKVLSGKVTEDVLEILLKFGSNYLKLAGISDDINKNKNSVREVIENGLALKNLEEIIELQGGDKNVLYSEIKAKNIVPVMSKVEGYISEIDVNQIRMLGIYLNSIRKNASDALDFNSGIKFEKKVGDFVSVGTNLGYVYTDEDVKVEEAVNMLRNAVIVSDKKVKVSSKVKFEI